MVAIAAEDFTRAVTQYKIEPTDGNKTRAAAAMISPDRLRFDNADSEREAEREIRVIGDEVVRTVSKIIAAGIEREASDIHIEPEATGVKVRFRVRGSLEDWSELVPSSMARGIVARVKVLSGLDITERRLPLDGRLGLSIGQREIDLRVSTVPTSRGEKVVLRICESAGMFASSARPSSSRRPWPWLAPRRPRPRGRCGSSAAAPAPAKAPASTPS